MQLCTTTFPKAKRKPHYTQAEQTHKINRLLNKISNPPLSCRWCASSSAGRRWWEPVPYLHGCRDRLRSAGVRSHGHLHQVRQEDERMPHLQAVRGAGGARLQVLTGNLHLHWKTNTPDAPCWTEQAGTATGPMNWPFRFKVLETCTAHTFFPERAAHFYLVIHWHVWNHFCGY